MNGVRYLETATRAPTIGEARALATAELRGQIRGVAGSYARRCASWAAAEAGPREFQARHAALRAALVHLELLLKLSGATEAGEQEEFEADFEAEAARNLARPA